MVRKRREEEGGEDECDRDERGDAGKGGPIVVDAGGRRSGARRGTWLLLPVCCCMSGSVRMGPLLRPPQWVVVARLSLGLCVLCAGGLVREFAAPPAFVRRSGDSSGGGCRIHSWFIVRVGYVVVSYASPGQVSFCIFFLFAVFAVFVVVVVVAAFTGHYPCFSRCLHRYTSNHSFASL